MIHLAFLVIFAFSILKSTNITFILSIISFAIMTYFSYFNKTKKHILSSEGFMAHDKDIQKAIQSLKSCNTYRTDINENIQKLLVQFFNTYFDLFYEWDHKQYQVFLDLEEQMLSSISSLEFERNNIKYSKAHEDMFKVTLKYRTILCNKYDIDINAPAPADFK